MRYTSIMLALSLTFFCCTKNNNLQQGTPSSEYFPNTEGDHWKYKYVDSLNNSTFDVNVNIIGTTTILNGQAAKIWTFSFSDHTDTNYVYEIADTIKFLNTNLNVVNTYVLPLTEGNKWRNFYFNDSIKVLLHDTVTISGNSFPNSFLLKEEAGGPNYYLHRNEWFSPNIGMLTKTRTEFDLGPVDNSYWQIEEYDLK